MVVWRTAKKPVKAGTSECLCGVVTGKEVR